MRVDGTQEDVSVSASGEASVRVSGLEAGRHRLDIAASDLQETKNSENASALALPNTRTRAHGVHRGLNGSGRHAAPGIKSSLRRVDLYEYQGKQLFARFGIPVSDGRVAFTPEEARAAAAEIGGPVVVKAQVLVGGRGKAGGIKLAATPDEAAERASEILGLDIRGHVVRTLWIESASDIEREYYFSITFDRGAKRPLFMLTTSGGVDIEEVAEKDPERSRACTSTRSPAGIPGSRASSASAPASPPPSASRSWRSSRPPTAPSARPTRCSSRSTR